MDRALTWVVDQIRRVEAHRSQSAALVRIALPPHVRPEPILARLQTELARDGSGPEIELVTDDVDQISLRALEFDL